MNMIQTILASPHFEKVVYVLFGALVIVVLTYICQRLLIREQYKMHKRLEEDRRCKQAEDEVKKLDARKKQIEKSLKGMHAFKHETAECLAIGVTLPNNTPEPFVIRRVAFKVRNNGFRGPLYDPEESPWKGRAPKKLSDGAVELPPFSYGQWIFPHFLREKAFEGFAQDFENCEVVVEFRMLQGDVYILTVVSDPPVAEHLSEFSRECVAEVKKRQQGRET